MMKKTLLILLFILLVSVLYFLNIYTPEQAEDFMYRYYNSAHPHEKGSDFILDNWGDVWKTIHQHYFIENGRLANDLAVIIQYIANGKSLFNVLNSVMICVLLMGVCLLGARRLTMQGMILALCGMIFIIPSARMTCLWLSGSLNYMWGGALVCVFFLCFRKAIEGRPLRRLEYVAMAASGFLASSMHEACGAPLVASIILYMALRKWRREPLPPVMWAAAFAVLLGAMLPILSPGIWHRAGKGSDGTFLAFLISTATVFVRYSFLPILLWGIAFIRKWRTTWDSIWSIYVFCNLGIAFLFARLSSLGLGVFYLNLSILIWLAVYGYRFAVRQRKVWVVPAALIVAFIAGRECWILYRIQEMEDEVRFQVQKNSVAVLDVDEDFGSHYMERCFCSPETYPVWHLMAEVKGLPRHAVVLRSRKLQPRELAVFDGLDESIAHVRVVGDKIVICLPAHENLITNFERLFLYPAADDSARKKCSLTLQRPNPVTAMFARILGKVMDFYALDYHKDREYIILMYPALEYDKFSFRTIHMETGKVRRMNARLGRTPYIESEDAAHE